MEAIVEAVYRDEPFPAETTNDMLDQLDPRHGKIFSSYCLNKATSGFGARGIMKLRKFVFQLSDSYSIRVSTFFAIKNYSSILKLRKDASRTCSMSWETCDDRGHPKGPP